MSHIIEYLGYDNLVTSGHCDKKQLLFQRYFNGNMNKKDKIIIAKIEQEMMRLMIEGKADSRLESSHKSNNHIRNRIRKKIESRDYDGKNTTNISNIIL
jgi:hypothetical protein